MGKLDLGVVKLCGALALAGCCGDGGGLDDLDHGVASPVPRCHLLWNVKRGLL